RGFGPVTICSIPTLEVVATLAASTNREAYVGVWSADGRFLAVKRQHDRSGVRSDWEVWNVGKTQRVVVVGPDVAHNSVTFHPQRPLVMTGHGGGLVTEWDVENGRSVRTFRFPNTAHALAYSPDGQRLAACYRVGSSWVVAFHDAVNPEISHTFDYP